MNTAAIPLRPLPSPLEKRLITIASGKGGVGKTWLAVTLAHALARQGRKVLLFDGDLGLANIDIQLGLTPNADLGDVISGRLELAEAVCRFEDATAAGCGFDIIAGRSGSGALAGLNRDALLGLREGLVRAAAHYDDVLLDLGAGIDQPVGILSSHTGRCLVVLTPEPTALTDAYAFIKLRTLRDPRCDVRVAVNMAMTRKDGEGAFETLSKAAQTFLKVSPKLAGIIRRDPKVPDAIRAQTSLLVRHGASHAAQDIEALALALIRS